MFSDGRIYCQSVAGFWPSGSYRTSGTNSRMRLVVRRLACGDAKAITMGDDAVEAKVSDMVSKYKTLGFDLKEPVPVTPENFEFCSKNFTSGLVIPVETSVRKMILNLVMHDTQEARHSIALELRDHPKYELFAELGLLPNDQVLEDSSVPDLIGDYE